MREVLRLAAFRRLAMAYGLNELATQAAAVVLAVFVFRRTGSAAGAAVFFLCTQFVPALLSPPLVARLEHVGAGVTLPAVYAVEALLFLALAGAVAQHVATVPLLALTLVDGLLALVARSMARAAAVAVTAPAGLLREGNAFNNSVFSLCYMVAPALGGALLVIGSSALALVVVAGIFAVVALALIGATIPSPAAEPTASGSGLRSALEYVRADPLVRRLFAVRAAALVFLTISIPVEVVLAQRTLHAGASGYALLLSAWGVGTVLGSLIYSAARRAAPWKMLTLAAALLGSGFLIMGLSPAIGWAIAGAAVAGAGNGIDAVASRTFLQEAVQPARMTLVMALNESLWQGAPGLGILIGGALAQLAGARAALLVAAGASGLLVVLTWQLRTSVQHPPNQVAV